MPSWLGSSSARLPVGQPPPGSAASNCGNPVETLALAARASSPPRRMSGRARRAANDSEPAKSMDDVESLPPDGGRAGSTRF